MLQKIFNSQTKTITGAAGILVVSALISRILGVLRDWLLAKTFGAGPDLDAYFAAFRIPDLVYNILIAGGIVVVFLPLFSEYFFKNKEEAWKFVNNLINIFLFLLIILCLILLIFASPLIKLITPGFNPQQINLTILLTRLMLLSPILLGLSSIFSGILQYFNRFLTYSLCPILYNLGIISGILFLSPCTGVLRIAIGVIFGAFLHFAIQVPSAISCGFRYQPIFNIKNMGIKKVFTLMLPRIFAIAGLQINLIVITAIASTLAAGSIVIFNLSNNLQYFPIGIIGVSFAVAAFPALTKSWVEGGKENFIKGFSSIFRQILYLTIPISVLIFILRNQIVEIILKHGEFNYSAAQLTAASLGLFSLGIFASSLTPLISRVFFSFQDTKTPTLIVVFSMALNIILSFYLTWILKSENFFNLLIRDTLLIKGIEDIRVLALPLAFSIGAIFQFLLLLTFLYRRIGDFKLKEIIISSFKIILASILMALGVYFSIYLISPLLNIQTLIGIICQTIITVLVGVIIYILSTFFFNSPEIKNIKSLILK